MITKNPEYAIFNFNLITVKNLQFQFSSCATRTVPMGCYRRPTASNLRILVYFKHYNGHIYFI